MLLEFVQFTFGDVGMATMGDESKLQFPWPRLLSDCITGILGVKLNVTETHDFTSV
jgi:hypothetical protein